MRSNRWSRNLLSVLLLLITSLTTQGQSVKVTVDDLTDDRQGSSMLTGMLQVQLKLSGGATLDKAVAARAVVKEATDDRGTNLAKDKKPGDFRSRDMNGGALDVTLDSPARDAKTFTMKGNIELFVPSKDPASTVTIPKAFAKLDKPFVSDGLASAGIKLTPLSPAKYAEEMKKQKLTDADIVKLRAEAKAHGASDKDIELAVGLAKAMQSMDDQPLPEGSVILSGSSAAFDKIQAIDILGADKKPINITSKETTTHGDSAVMVMRPDSLPGGASLRLTLLTSKSRVSVPFEVKNVELP
jgi:hypothetical protein